MNVWVFDLDYTLQVPEYAHPELMENVAEIVGEPFESLNDHYLSEEYVGNEAEEKFHLLFCKTEEQREKVKSLWRKLYDNIEIVTIIPGASELLEAVEARGDVIFAYTKGVGTEELQRRRLTSIGLDRYFPTGNIVSSVRKGSAEAIEQVLLPRLPEGRKIFVGDMFDVDVTPALEIPGSHCVWVQGDRETPRTFPTNRSNLTIVKGPAELAKLVKKGAFDENTS